MQGKYNFIILQKIILRNFSLYRKKGKIYEVNEDINQGVYCLAGANGLGKTTFLNALNYGLTGIVLEPDKHVLSPAEIVKANKDYTKRYFVGRITEADKKKAEIEITFTVNDKYFRLIRGFFEPDTLSLLEVYTSTGTRKKYTYKAEAGNGKKINEDYQKTLTAEIGFINFDYFIFYQLYVLTFDENRRMIFWDDRASSNALAAAFNSDPTDAERIAQLTRKMEKYESNARNAKWQAKQASKKVEELSVKVKTKKATDFEKLEREFNRLHQDAEKKERTLDNIRTESDTIQKRQTSLNAEIMQLRTEHSKLFSRYTKPRSKILENTNVALSIKKHECIVCGSLGSHVADNIQRNIHKNACPLCNTIINDSNNTEQKALLRSIQENDKKIDAKNTELEQLVGELQGKKEELDRAEIEYRKAREKVEEFSDDNPNIGTPKTGDAGIDTLIQQYKKQQELAENESREEYGKRDKLKPEYEKLLKKVESAYNEAETEFVPIFKKLAKSFIGHELNIHPKTTGKGLKLVLTLQNSARTESFQLSESQRFFLDIALRMALAIFLSKKDIGSTFLVDTPEGSLDIAYEGRVGNMFAEFTMTYHQNLLMTANINASQLLLNLAQKCGKRNMKFRRMLEWTDLSEIQKEGEELFKQVYTRIESALNTKR